jgi:hypothetical protein
MMLASLASLGVMELIGSLRRPARCWRRALACKMGINTLAPYCISLTRHLSATESHAAKIQQFITMNSLLRYTFPLNPLVYQRKRGEENALATVPCTEVSNKMVQSLGWLQVAKCTQGNIFNLIDEALAGSRHDVNERAPRKSLSN